MRHDFRELLREATRLTREGDLHAATAAIQQALAGRTGRPQDEATIIDVEAREVPEGDDAARLQPPPPADPSTAPAAAPAAEAPRARPAPTGPGAFTTDRFGGAGLAGRDYKLYVPPGAGAEPLPLVVMLHGCTQDPDDFAAGTRMNDAAREQGFFVLYPTQSQKANSHRCWNWFKHTHQQRERGEPALIAGMVRQVMARHAIDPARVYVAGLSAGGAMAAVLAETYPELFAAVGVHSGLPVGAASDLPAALQAMKDGARSARPLRVPAFVIHGDADKTVHPGNADQVVRSVVGLLGQAPGEDVPAAGARRSTRRVYRDAQGRVIAEHWTVHGGPHAWSGGSRAGSYTDPQGPDATAEMLRFFREHPRAG